MEIRAYLPDDRDQVIQLWRRCGLIVPHNDPDQDIDLCISSGHGQIFVGCGDGVLAASVMVGHDGHRGWMYYLAVSPEHQGEGIGQAMVAHAEQHLRQRGARKIQLMVRETNCEVIAFYKGLGYELQPCVTMAKWLRPPPA